MTTNLPDNNKLMNYRKLRNDEIRILESQGCSCKNWDLVEVTEEFTPGRVRESSFSGAIRMGRFLKVFELAGGVLKKAGIRNVALHNVEIGDDCYIENVHNYIANYKIGAGCFIENVDIIVTEGFSKFGNGVCANVLNETGGREVYINDKLSAHLAYFSALYRHRPELAKKLHALSSFYANKHGGEYGTIGDECKIINTGKISAVKIGNFCTIQGTALLENGSINSTAEDPVFIGSGVRAKDFIISSGANIDTFASIERCFIGQSTVLANSYVATDSVFFSNCHGENGEACSIFAGPFTVTHHKSSLLIAGMFSFMNAGSGSNQSNHMYKLGPIHQGIMERGAKTSSDSYILWPAHVGAFSLVMGRHVFHIDSANLPFSYLIEKKNVTYLIPGVNLRSVGTIRDAQKWPKRDNRKDPHRLDQINYNLLSPYTVQKMMNGIAILKALQETSGENTDVFSYHSAKINNSSLVKGIMYYNIAIKKFLGNSIIKRLEKFNNGASTTACNEAEKITTQKRSVKRVEQLAQKDKLQEMREMLRPTTNIGLGDWVDISGLIAPKTEIDKLLCKIENGTVKRLGEINDILAQMHSSYYDYEWTWAASKIEEYFGIKLPEITFEQVIEIVNQWQEVVVSLDKMVYDDAKKEFSLAVQTSFGPDGSESEKAMDFEQVRGQFNNNTFVTAVLEHIKVKTALGEELKERLNACR
jgi:hypothetical protein